jgi:hypothetical protein
MMVHKLGWLKTSLRNYNLFAGGESTYLERTVGRKLLGWKDEVIL